MNRKDLEYKLSEIETFDDPKAELEQYQTPPGLVADILWNAKIRGEIENNRIIDLGCGTGIFAIGAKLLGARKVTALDIDKKAIELAKKNAEKLNVDINFIEKDIADTNIKSDVVFQNPPFGCQDKGKDMIFLEKALEFAPIVYTMHMTETADYIEDVIQKSNSVITDDMSVKYPLPKTFDWHSEQTKYIEVTVYRIKRR